MKLSIAVVGLFALVEQSSAKACTGKLMAKFIDRVLGRSVHVWSLDRKSLDDTTLQKLGGGTIMTAFGNDLAAERFAVQSAAMEDVPEQLSAAKITPSSKLLANASGDLEALPSGWHQEHANGLQPQINSLAGISQDGIGDFLFEIFKKENTGLPKHLLDPAFWESMACGPTIRLPRRANSGFAFTVEQLGIAKKSIQHAGYARLTDLAWEELGVSVKDLADTIDSLKAHGIPPVFIFMYDQIWLLLLHLFDAMPSIMGVELDNVRLDLSVFAWSLFPSQEQGRVGSSFGRPHRDNSYEQCHTRDGKPSVVSVWLPLVPVTAHNGCMYVLPAHKDPLFNMSEHELHLRPEKRMMWECIRPLLADAGDVLFWKANLVHWGSACDDRADQPRKSVAAAFALPDAVSDPYFSLSKRQLKDALSTSTFGLSTRLRIVLRGLLVYEHWHPKYLGFDPYSLLNLPQEDVKKHETCTHAPSAAGSAAKGLAPQQKVRIVGLQSKSELNGAVGILTKFNGAKGRWQTKVTSGETFEVKPQNLEPV